jgi:hypothetical protein
MVPLLLLFLKKLPTVLKIPWVKNRVYNSKSGVAMTWLGSSSIIKIIIIKTIFQREIS